MDFNKIIKAVTNKNRVAKFLFMVFGIFVLALNYNLFFVQNELVVGGVSGLAIVFHKLMGINMQIFIYTMNIILLLVSFFVFGFKKTRPAIIGSILYPFMITFTLPLSKILVKYVVFEDLITTIVITSILYGLASALIYKMGYNTGGSDIVIQIMKKYFHMSDGKASFISSVVVILFGAFSLGVTKAVYAIMIVYISSVIVDKTLIGISKSKLFIIESSHIEEIQKLIMEDLHLGVTILKASGGYTKEEKELLMCAIPTKDYTMFKQIILTMDPHAFFIIEDCYDIAGGMTKNENSLQSLFW